MSTKRPQILTISLLTITALSGAVLSSSVSATDNTDAVDSVSIGVPISCSMEGTGMNSHTASIPNGTYQADIGTTTLKAYCNDDEGFAIFAIGYTNSEYGNNNLTGQSSSTNIVTGTASSGNTSNWAMKLATDSTATYPLTLDNSFNSYSNVPASYTKVAHRDSGTDIGESATGSSLTTTYAAFISKTESADTYMGKVKYTLVHPSSETPLQPIACEAGKICYNANASDIVGEMGKQSASNNSSVDLWASNFSRTGYGFAGWNDKFDYSGNFYGPNETITTPSDVSTNGLSLYAVWIKSAGTIQNWNGCSGLASGATTALTDGRDNNTYAVAKLADGKCWMIENLRLADKDSSNNDIDLDSTNTHNPSLPLTNDYANSTTSNHLSPTIDSTQITWCSSDSSACMDQSMLSTDNTTLFTNNTASYYSISNNVYSIGNYYNWYSATAGYGKYGSSYGSGYTAPGDICPAGWHLPKGGNKSQESTNEFWQLIVTGINSGANPANYNSSSQPNYTGTPEGSDASNTLRVYPNNFVYSGYILGSSVGDRNFSGAYWSASGGNIHSAFYMNFYSSSVHPGTNIQRKYYGGVVRCVADN